MKVINLNSKFDLTKVQIDFAEAIMSWYSRDKHNSYEFDFNFLMDKIPVFLINEDTLEVWERENRKEYQDENREERRLATEWLGLYMSKCNILSVKHPVIALCPERIVDSVRNEKELCWLVAKVLIHEFSHAAMDKSDYGIFDKFHYWMEEPMANLLTLSVVEWYERKWLHSNYHCYSQFGTSSALTIDGDVYNARDFYDFVLNFVRSQPDNYRIAADLHTEGLFHAMECDGWARKKGEWRNCAWQKKLWLDYFDNVLSGKCLYNDVVAYEIWESFDSMRYEHFKAMLKYFQGLMTEASKGNMPSDDKIGNDVKMFRSHLYGDFRIELDRADWKNSYIWWECHNVACNVQIHPNFDDSENLCAFEYFNPSDKKKYSFGPNSMDLNEDDEPNKTVVCFLDTFTEAAIRSIF